MPVKRIYETCSAALACNLILFASAAWCGPNVEALGSYDDPYRTLSAAERRARTGDLNTAERMLTRLLSQQVASEKETVLLTWVLDALSEVYLQKGDYDAAEPLVMRSIKVKKDLYGSNQVELQRTLRNYNKLIALKGTDHRHKRSRGRHRHDVGRGC